MRKDFKSKSKKKWITGGILLFGGIALLTTGFATWVVGVNRSKVGSDIDMEQEGTVNEMFKLSVKLTDSKVVISEQHTKAANEIIGTKAGSPATDFEVAGTFTVEVGNEYGKLPDKVNFSFGYSDVEGATPEDPTYANTDKNKVNVAAVTRTHAVGDYEYLKIATTSSLTVTDVDSEKGFEGVWTKTEGTSSTKWTITTKFNLLDWGSFFNETSPCTYYNGLYDPNGTYQETITAPTLTDDNRDIDFVTKEMNDMKDLFHKKKIKVIATLTEKDK